MAAAVATQTKPEKIWYFEWLRALACMAVVMLHCMTEVLHKYSFEDIGLERAFWWTEFRLFLAWPVPIFLMITGALLLNPEKEVGYRKALAYAKRIGIVLGSFGFIFALIKLVFSSKSFSPALIPEAILNVLQGESWSHLWYLYALIGIYLLTPVFKAFIKTASKDELKIFLIILFVLTCLIPFINDFTGWNIETLIWFSNSVFYFVLGYYLYAFGEFNSMIGALACGALVIEAAIAGGGVLMRHEFLGWIYSYKSPCVVLEGIAVFLLAKKFLIAKPNTFMLKVARSSFAIYVVHTIFTNGLYKALHWANVALPPVVFEAVTFLIVFGCSYVLAAALKRLPWLGRYL